MKAPSKKRAAKKNTKPTAKAADPPKAAAAKAKSRTKTKTQPPVKRPVKVEALPQALPSALEIPAASPEVQAHKPEATHDQLCQRAYEIWIEKGRPYGQEDANWAQALAELGGSQGE